MLEEQSSRRICPTRWIYLVAQEGTELCANWSLKQRCSEYQQPTLNTEKKTCGRIKFSYWFICSIDQLRKVHGRMWRCMFLGNIILRHSLSTSFVELFIISPLSQTTSVVVWWWQRFKSLIIHFVSVLNLPLNNYVYPRASVWDDLIGVFLRFLPHTDTQIAALCFPQLNLHAIHVGSTAETSYFTSGEHSVITS